jgi:hypothetical protein
MGLHLARQVCDQITIRRGATGSTVTLQMSLPDTRHNPAATMPGRNSAARIPAALDGDLVLGFVARTVP